VTLPFRDISSGCVVNYLYFGVIVKEVRHGQG
jgi:hypothetical protein